MVSYETMEYDVQNGIAEIYLNRPEVMNAFNDVLLDEFYDALQKALGNNNVYIILLSGKGKGFCSGVDMNHFQGRGEEDKLTSLRELWQVQTITRTIYNANTPVISAVNGPAIGPGSDFAFASDFRIISESAFFRQHFVNIGQIPADGGAWLLPRLIGESKAKEYLLTGKKIHPEEAKKHGLVMDVVERENLIDRSKQLAEELKMKPAKSLQDTKELIDVNQSFGSYLFKASEYAWKHQNSPEAEEAISAFLEKREPEFDR